MPGPPSPPLRDPQGRPYAPFAVVDVRWYGTWRRGRVVKVGRRRLWAEIVEGYGTPGHLTYRRPHQVYMVSPS